MMMMMMMINIYLKRLLGQSFCLIYQRKRRQDLCHGVIPRTTFFHVPNGTHFRRLIAVHPLTGFLIALFFQIHEFRQVVTPLFILLPLLVFMQRLIQLQVVCLQILDPSKSLHFQHTYLGFIIFQTIFFSDVAKLIFNSANFVVLLEEMHLSLFDGLEEAMLTLCISIFFALHFIPQLFDSLAAFTYLALQSRDLFRENQLLRPQQLIILSSFVFNRSQFLQVTISNFRFSRLIFGGIHKCGFILKSHEFLSSALLYFFIYQLQFGDNSCFGTTSYITVFEELMLIFPLYILISDNINKLGSSKLMIFQFIFGKNISSVFCCIGCGWA